MATYLELYGLRDDSDLKSRVAAAMMIAADVIYDEAIQVPARRSFADLIYQSPDTEAPKMLWMVLAANKGASVAAIKSATDATILANVNTAINKKFGPAA